MAGLLYTIRSYIPFFIPSTCYFAFHYALCDQSQQPATEEQSKCWQMLTRFGLTRNKLQTCPIKPNEVYQPPKQNASKCIILVFVNQDLVQPPSEKVT